MRSIEDSGTASQLWESNPQSNVSSATPESLRQASSSPSQGKTRSRHLPEHFPLLVLEPEGKAIMR